MKMIDLNGGVAELEIREDGKVVWFNVNGITVARVNKPNGIVLTDHRPTRTRSKRVDVDLPEFVGQILEERNK